MFLGPHSNPAFQDMRYCMDQCMSQDHRMCAIGMPTHGFFPQAGGHPQLGSAVYMRDGFPAFFIPGAPALAFMPHAHEMHMPRSQALHQNRTAATVAPSNATAEKSVSKKQTSLAVASGSAVAPPATAAHVKPWIHQMLASSFFGPCDVHKNLKKNECTFFCVTCSKGPHALCQHCMSNHQNHQIIQIRRYVYCDVIRCVDINQYIETEGVQCYIINQAKVVFLNPRPQSKVGRPSSPDTCRTCSRHLREGAAYCCLACKVAALAAGDSWAPSSSHEDEEVVVDGHESFGMLTANDDSPRPSGSSPRTGQCGVTSSTSSLEAFEALTASCTVKATPRSVHLCKNITSGMSPTTLALLHVTAAQSASEEDEEEVDLDMHQEECYGTPIKTNKRVRSVVSLLTSPGRVVSTPPSNIKRDRATIQPSSASDASEGWTLRGDNNQVLNSKAQSTPNSTRRKQTKPQKSAE